MTAGDKAWEIVATGTEHMNRGAYDKWINLKDKVQPSLMDKAFEHVKKELINAAEKTVKEEKPELKGDAYSTQLQSLMNSWTTRICLLHTKPSDIIVQPATQVSDYKDTHLHTLINQSMNITVIDDPTTPLTLGILTDKISACMTAINSKTTGSQSQSQSQLQSQSQSQSTNNIQQQMKPTLETKNTIKQHNAIILHHPTTQQHNPTTQQHINSSLPVLPPIRMIEDTDITTSSSHRMKGREKKEKISDKKKHAQEIAYRQAILNAVTSISEHIAKMAQQSTIRLRDKYPTPTTFYRDWNLNTDVITKLPSNIRSSIDLVDLDYTVLVNAGVSIGKANAIMKTLDAFITTGRV